MMPAQLAALLLPLLPVSNDPANPQLSIEYLPSAIAFHVEQKDAVFAGAVILSLEPTLCHYLHSLPPLLCDRVVIGSGLGHGSLVISVEESALPPGIFIYAQGVTLDLSAIEPGDELVIKATNVVDFVLDASKPIE